MVTPGAMLPPKKTTREEGEASILLPRGYRNLVPRPRSSWFPHVSETQDKSLIKNFRWLNWSPMMIRNKRTGIVGIVFPDISLWSDRSKKRDKVRWSLTHSILINLFIKVKLYTLLLPPLLGTTFVQSAFYAYVWHILEDTSKAYTFFPTQKSSQPKMGFV